MAEIDLRRKPYCGYPDKTKEACIWTTKDGRRLGIAEMEDRHLLNTIAMLQRTAPLAQAAALNSVAGGLAVISGEMALDALEREERYLTEASSEEFLEAEHPQYLNLLHEAERRGLVIPEVNEERAAAMTTLAFLHGQSRG